MAVPDTRATTPEFDFEVLPERDGARIALRGEFDLAAVAAVRSAIAQMRGAGFARIAIDLRGLSFMDSSGVHLIFGEQATARSNGHTVEVIRGPDGVQRVFELCGMLEHVSFGDR